MIRIPYNFKKGLSNLAFIFTGVLVIRLAPYSDSLTNGTIPPDLAVWSFWKHLLVSSCVITFTAELKYFYRYLATMNGDSGGTVIQTPTTITGGTDAKKNPLQLS